MSPFRQLDGGLLTKRKLHLFSGETCCKILSIKQYSALNILKKEIRKYSASSILKKEQESALNIFKKKKDKGI